MPNMKSIDLRSLRLLVYVEQRFWRKGRIFSTDEPFVIFMENLLPQISKLIYVARLNCSEESARYLLHPDCDVWGVQNYKSMVGLFVRSIVIIPRMIWQLSNRRREWDAALICGPHLIGFFIAMVCELLHRPYIIMVRENILTRVSWRYAGLLRSIALIQSRLLELIFISLSRHHPTLIVGEEMQRKYKLAGAQVLPLFVSLVKREQLWHKKIEIATNGHEPFQFLYVGRIDPDKGLGVLIDTFSSLSIAGKKMHLNIVGEGPERNTLESKVSSLSLQSNISFLGYVPHGEELFQLYHEADAFVLPSFSEGFPQVIIEAMASSLPIIATRVGGIPEIVKHEKNGLLVSPGSKDELYSMLLHLMETPDLYKKLSDSAFKTAEGLTQDVQVDVMINTLKEVI